MPPKIPPINLQTALEQECEQLRKPNGAVLFRRGDHARGVFIVLSGKVSLDFGVDCFLARAYSRGALVGLPATLTGKNYAMTATVTEDAVLGFWSRSALESLLRERPQYYRELLDLLGERMAENRKFLKAHLGQDEQQPVEQVGVV
jgi:CRP-like cAMP-binding protein